MPKTKSKRTGVTEESKEVSDVLVIGGIVMIGGIALYSIATILGDVRAIGKYTGGGAEWWAARGDTEYKRVTGAPAYLWTEFWNQTTGQEGLGWTDKPEGERHWTKADKDSWGWGYGPKKGWLFGG